MEKEMKEYLLPGKYIDSDHPSVIKFAHQNASHTRDEVKKAVALYGAVRDGFRYDPYHIDLTEEGMKANNLLTRISGYCVEKANLLAAAARVVGIPSRLGFANVRNHIGTDKFAEILKTDILVFHGYTELFLLGKWVKATPAFNRELCHKLQVASLEFDGLNHSIFQEYNHAGHQYMQYLKDYGQFSDLPRDLFIKELRKHYGHLFINNQLGEKGVKVHL